MLDLLILPSARKHRITDEAIRHALDNAVDFWAAYSDEDLDMYIGPALDGSMLEIGVIPAEDRPGLVVVVHAMKARSKFIRTKKLRRR